MTPDELRSRLTITVREAAEILGIGRNSAYEAAKRGELPVIRFGGRLVVPVARFLQILGLEPVRNLSDESGTPESSDGH